MQSKRQRTEALHTYQIALQGTTAKTEPAGHTFTGTALKIYNQSG